MKAKLARKLTLDQRARRRLKRLEKRRLKAMPLFVATGVADQLAPLPSLPQIKRFIEHCQQDICRRVLTNYLRSLRRAKHYQSLVAALVPPTQFRQLAQRRTIYPPTPDYAADHWQRAYNHLVNLP